MNRQMIGLALAAGVACHAVGQDLRVRVPDPLLPLYGTEDAATLGSNRTLRLVGPRNGYCSAPVVVSDGGSNLSAKCSALSNSAYTIPASAIRVRYATREEGYDIGQLDEREGHQIHRFLEAYYDRLSDAPPTPAAFQPVWLTVAVPPAAPPGLYTGSLRVGAATVPVELRVGRWACPPPAAWTTHVGVPDSPEVLALRYGLPFWSERHWALIEQVMRDAAALGSDDLWIHVLPANGHGKGLAMVSFRTEEGRIVPDFTVLDRYLDLYARCVGKPQFVLVDVWNRRPAGRKGRPARREATLIVDGEPRPVPCVGDPAAESVWRGLMDGIRQRVAARGWRESGIMLALAGDERPEAETVIGFRQIAPYARWAIWTHGRGDPVAWAEDVAGDADSPVPVIGYYAHPYTPSFSAWARAPGKPAQKVQITGGIQGGWNHARAVYASTRNDIHKYAAPSQWRSYANGCMVSGYGMENEAAGFAFLWLDFWTLPGSTVQPFLNHWCSTLNRKNSESIIEPGLDGPVVTVRYEMLREGLQECEARVAIEKALVGGGLSGERAVRVRAFLEETVRLRFLDGRFSGGHAGGNLGLPEHMWGVAEYPRWQDLTLQLFDLAGDL